MHVLDNLRARGLIADLTDEEGIKRLSPGTPFYLGVDPTAPSMQFGNLVVLVLLMRLGLSGYSPIILFGGATGAIGDPGGKKTERKLLDREQITENVNMQREKTLEIFDRKSLKATFVDNYDWTKGVEIIDFLREIGKHFTVNYMLQKESVRTRLEGDGISFTEFSYMLLQAFDFLHLYKTYGCKMQIGATDQWGNMTAGLELIRRKLQGEAYVLCAPLLTDRFGKKLGKSESGTVWLNGKYTSSYKFHQYLLNTDDAEIVKLLNFYSFSDLDTLRLLEASTKSNPEKREAQKFLADELCTLVHGAEATADAKRCAEVLFGGSIKGLSDSQLQEIFSDVPSSVMSRSTLKGMSAIDLFATLKLTPSKGEARRLLTQGGAYINNERVEDGSAALDGVLSGSATVVLRSGKKNYHLLRVTDG